ncbi:MAG TPA: hypothetical protein VH395_18305 [Jatrophihabitantaceae bacterium]
MRRAALVLVAVALLASCTSGGGTPSSSPSVRTETVTHTRSPTAEPTAPISTGPTRATTAATCPLLPTRQAADHVGMRLARITVLHSGGKVVGCRFYALQDSPLSESEHLPGPKQPVIEITTFRYPSERAAHNAFVRIAEHGSNVQTASIVGQAPGACFQTDFYAKDDGEDWACAFSKGDTMVLVRTVVTSPALSAILVARAVAERI